MQADTVLSPEKAETLDRRLTPELRARLRDYIEDFEAYSDLPLLPEEVQISGRDNGRPIEETRKLIADLRAVDYFYPYRSL